MKDFVIIISIFLLILFSFFTSFIFSLFKPINFKKGIITLQSREYIKQQESLELLKLIENNKKNFYKEYENFYFR
jgi:hypothetical protein